jgi:hypothetical protein
MIPLFAVVSIAMFCLFVAALVTLTTTRAIFGVSLAASMPLWVAALLLCLVYGLIASPLHHARRAIYMQRRDYHQAWFAAWDGFFSVGLMAVVGWFAYTHVPQVHEFFQHFPENVQTMWNNVVESFHHVSASR